MRNKEIPKKERELNQMKDIRVFIRDGLDLQYIDFYILRLWKEIYIVLSIYKTVHNIQIITNKFSLQLHKAHWSRLSFHSKESYNNRVHDTDDQLTDFPIEVTPRSKYIIFIPSSS